MSEGLRVVGTGRFGREETTASGYSARSTDLEQAVLTLDLLRSLGWLVRHGVRWPGRPGVELQHLLIGPAGVFVLSVDTQETEVDAAAPGDWQPRAEDALAAATDVAAALPGVPVTPVVCFTRAEAFTGVAGSVFLCSLRNVVEVLSHAPVRIDAAALAAVHREVTDRWAGPAVPVAAMTAPTLQLVTPSRPAAFEDLEPELVPSSSYDLYGELAHLDGPVGVEAAERIAAEQAEKARVEAQRLEVERHAAEEAARREQRAAEVAAGQLAVEAARERKARLRGSTAAATAQTAQAEHEVAAVEQPRWQLARPKSNGLMAAIVIAVLALGGSALQQPIGSAAGAVRSLFTERAPARFGEQVNIGKTAYHPRLRLHAGHPVAVPGRAEVAIPFRVRNSSEDAWVLETADLLMLDRLGVSHAAKAGPPIPHGAVLRASTPVAAGTTVTGFLLFDLPPGQTVKELRLTLGSGEAAEGAGDRVLWFSRVR